MSYSEVKYFSELWPKRDSQSVIHLRRIIIFCFGSACSRAQPGGRSMNKASCLFVYLTVIVLSPILCTNQLSASGAFFKVASETRKNCYDQTIYLHKIVPQISRLLFSLERTNKEKFWSHSAAQQPLIPSVEVSI